MSSGQDIATSIKGRLWNTLFLAFWAAIVAVPLAIILGLIAVRYRNGWVDKLISGLALASTSFPEFFIGYVLVYFFAVKWQIFPGISTVYDGMPFGERMQAIALPATALTLVVLAHMMRMTRAAILNVMQSAYIETAELKGLSAFNVIRKHAFPNALAPIINVVMLNLAYLIVGVVVVEVIFVYPGMGQYLVDHVTKRDVPVVQACRPDLRRRLYQPEHHRGHCGDRRQSAPQASEIGGGHARYQTHPHPGADRHRADGAVRAGGDLRAVDRAATAMARSSATSGSRCRRRICSAPTISAATCCRA